MDSLNDSAKEIMLFNLETNQFDVIKLPVGDDFDGREYLPRGKEPLKSFNSIVEHGETTRFAALMQVLSYFSNLGYRAEKEKPLGDEVKK